jgi:uncharacterized protein with LGFP repeats
MTAIDDKRNELPFLGNPVDEGAGSAEMDLGDGRGRARDYQNGSIYWTPQTGAHEVHGAIRVKWAQLGGHRSFLGYPVTDETGTPDGRGRFNHFEHGSIYCRPPVPAGPSMTSPRTCSASSLATSRCGEMAGKAITN